MSYIGFNNELHGIELGIYTILSIFNSEIFSTYEKAEKEVFTMNN